MPTKTLEKCKESACTATPTRYTTRPRTRVYEDETSFLLDVEMPGISETDAEITVHQNELTIAAEAEGLEFRYERRFKLPSTINTSKVSATMQLGILKLVLPKTEAAKPKTIKVIAG